MPTTLLVLTRVSVAIKALMSTDRPQEYASDAAGDTENAGDSGATAGPFRHAVA